MGLFGTSGIRGDAEKLFTNQFCLDFGRAFVQFLKNHNQNGPIAIGMDTRQSSPRIVGSLVQGLAIEGREVYHQGVCPIPAIGWILKFSDICGSIMVSGSHIAGYLNGIKFFALGEEITKGYELEIEEIYHKLQGEKQIPEYVLETKHEHRAQGLYTTMLKGLINTALPRWKVVIDCANGGQSVVMPELLSQLGLKVIRINCDITGDFIARDTDTDDKAEIKELKRQIIDEDADFGIAYDGDGDRVVFIDELGKFVLGEYSCGLVAKQIQTDTIVTPISASQVVDHLEKRVVRTKVGSPYVIAGMKESGAKFGFEPNGGAIFAENMYTRDGGSMTMKMLNLFASWQGKFSEMVGQLPKFYMVRTKVDCPAELNTVILDSARISFKSNRVENLDGLKIWFDQTTWLLFRPSSNAPEFRVFAESNDESKARELLNRGIEFVKGIIKGHAQPTI